MEAQPYDEMTDLDLLKLAVWREARNQTEDAMRAVACSIRNRVEHPSWWGHDWQTVILKPWQYSSFNVSDPNNTKWPEDYDISFLAVTAACEGVYDGSQPDVTDGATHYYDTSIEFPKSWGSEALWTNTLNLGAFRFWKQNG